MFHYELTHKHGVSIWPGLTDAIDTILLSVACFMYEKYKG